MSKVNQEVRIRDYESHLPVIRNSSFPISMVSQAAMGFLATPAHKLNRKQLRRALAEGALDELEFDAVVWRNVPNANHVRFRAEELPRLAASFEGAPFLRNHDHADIGSRDGMVLTSRINQQGEMLQRIKLTTQRGIADFLDGIIDRFSIAWYWGWIECSVCGQDWLVCEHVPGRTYQGVTTELIFVHPHGKETSAVNTPAVPDTHVLAQLCQLKEIQMQGEEGSKFKAQSSIPEVPGSMFNLQGAEASAVNLEPETLNGGITRPVEEQLADLQAEVLRLRGQVAAQAERTLVTGIRPLDYAARPRAGQAPGRPITAGDLQTPLDRAQAAMEWIFGNPLAPPPPPSMRSLADLYQAITGDVNWYGRFDPAWAQLAAATTTTLAGLVVNAMNKASLQHFNNMITYRWYEQIVNVLPHSGETHDISMITVDGLASLPTVSEGQAYTELSVGDARETMSFAKKGGYVGITLEAIRRSDIQRLQAIPRELVKSAVRTRSAAIASIFTVNSGTGPTLADDSTVLFHANHGGNVATTALSASAWGAVRQVIYEQSVPGTSAPLGLWPSFLLVPIELYDTALVLFGYGGGDVGRPISAATAQEVNPYAQSRTGDPRPVVVATPDWTDATDWAAIVDPRLHPVIHMAYANAPGGGSHPLPEIYEVTSESAGLIFTNDVLPIKARDWWAYGVSTYVGIAKRNVA